jgi:hypothetical protein
MRFLKIIRKRLDHSQDGVNVAGGIDAVVSANVNEPGKSRTSVRSRQTIVQRSGRTDQKSQDEGGTK